MPWGRRHHSLATTAAAKASEVRNWAVSSVVFQAEDPVTNLSGTTNTSPGCILVLDTPPENQSPVPLDDTTDPFARMIYMPFLLASSVGPPDCRRYHSAVFPGLKVMALGLYTSPYASTKLGFLGMVIKSPARNVMSDGVFSQFETSGLMVITNRPETGWLLSWLRIWLCCCCIACMRAAVSCPVAFGATLTVELVSSIRRISSARPFSLNSRTSTLSSTAPAGYAVGSNPPTRFKSALSLSPSLMP